MAASATEFQHSRRRLLEVYLRRSLSSVLPNRGVPAAMENGQNDDTMSFRAEVHAKRESLGDDTANILPLR
jgi:hypothetical protein